MDKIKMIKKDAIVDIKIGSGFLKKLQQLLMHLSQNISQEDIAKYSEEAKGITSIDHEFSEPWMEAITTVSFLIRTIEEGAENQGFTYEKDIESAIKDLEDTTNIEEN